ncbi:glycosyltransferase [Puniceicoccus vermicola]|uniref:Glycosyltransferase family 4 protein n=1 Tax=Puniceicoccus vermicola TaxID=388746 RepID=A0A7X1B0F0_9BACT|nr:glycosyltransferase family 4 protein [Puniceicoccus vermicola]
MRVAVFHNYYALPGGEDVVFELECKTLESMGHTVLPFVVRNSEVFGEASAFQKIGYAWRTPYNREIHREVSQFLKENKADIGHVHNWFPILSPAIYDAHHDCGIPVVQTLHNYRIGCASGTFRREEKSCHDCTPGHTLPSVRHKCYRNSRIGSLSWMRTVNRAWSNGTYTQTVDRYICPSQEVANQHRKMGLPDEKITIIPNGCERPVRESQISHQDSVSDALFVGRLTPEKGTDVAIEAWRILTKLFPPESPPTLRIVGQGPDEERLRTLAENIPGIHFCGQQPRERVTEFLHSTKALIFPSRWAEPFGLGMIEAFSAGCPVIASNCGAPAEIIKDGVQGFHFPVGSAPILSEKLTLLLSDSEMREQMGLAARQHYEANFTPEAHAEQLLSCFEKTLKEHPQSQRASQ